jgi:hypothetical protein
VSALHKARLQITCSLAAWLMNLLLLLLVVL